MRRGIYHNKSICIIIFSLLLELSTNQPHKTEICKRSICMHIELLISFYYVFNIVFILEACFEAHNLMRRRSTKSKQSE